MKNDEKGNEKCKPGSCKNHNCKKRCLKEAIINNLKVERKWRKHANQTRDHNWTNMISKKYEKMQKSRSALCFCTCIFFFPFLISIFCFTWCISPRLHFSKVFQRKPTKRQHNTICCCPCISHNQTSVDNSYTSPCEETCRCRCLATVDG